MWKFACMQINACMILLLGSSGYVGKAFKKYFDSNGIEYCNLSVRYPLDCNDFAQKCLKNNVSVVYNCSGYIGKPNVDACELNKEDTLMGNAILPYQLAKVCSKYSIKFVHISSGCIYTDANCDNALQPSREFVPTDEPNFSFFDAKYSWYSGTKALGERLVEEFDNVMIARLRIPFNAVEDDRNYITKILKYPVLLNATNSFSQLDEFVATTHKLDAAHYAGIFNITQPGYLSTQQVIEMLNKHGLAIDKLFYKNASDFEKTVKAPRSNCVLDSSRVIRCGMSLTPIEVAMQECIDQYAFNTKHA